MLLLVELVLILVVSIYVAYPAVRDSFLRERSNEVLDSEERATPPDANGTRLRIEAEIRYERHVFVNDESVVAVDHVVKPEPSRVKCEPKIVASGLSIRQDGWPAYISSDTEGVRYFDVSIDCDDDRLDIYSTGHRVIIEPRGKPTDYTIPAIQAVMSIIAIFITDFLRRRSETKSKPS